MKTNKMFRFKWKVTIFTIISLLLSVGTAFATAPDSTLQQTTTLTSTAYTGVTYTGYMNGESFQQDGIITYNGWQYAAYWNSAKHVNISRRQLPSGNWQNIELTDYTSTVNDSHNTISMGISAGDGSIHLAFDHHDSNLHYRVSTTGLASNPGAASWTASDFGAVTSNLTGTSITSVTYPQFISAPGGKLQLAFRVGASGAGDEVLYEYSSGTWTNIGKFIDGTTLNNNAYLFGIEYDGAGVLHTTWTWRETPDANTNHDIMYAYSTDQGRTWKDNAGATIAVSGSTFINSNTTSAKVVTIAQNRGLMNQESQVVDSNGIVHIVASHLPDNVASTTNFALNRDNSVVIHYYRNTSGTWVKQNTIYKEENNRSDIVVDSNNNVYIVVPNDYTKTIRVISASKASGWTDWEVKYQTSAIHFSDPLIDHARIKAENVLSFYAPQNASGNILVYDLNVGSTYTANLQDLALYDAVTASSTYETANWGLTKVTDGGRSTVSNSNGWTSSSNLTTNHTEWVKVDLGLSTSISKVDLYPRNDGVNTGYGFPINFTIDVSQDNVTWTSVVTKTNYSLPTGTAQSFAFPTQNARYVRVNGTSLRANPNDGNTYRMQLAEFEVYQ